MDSAEADLFVLLPDNRTDEQKKAAQALRT